MVSYGSRKADFHLHTGALRGCPPLEGVARNGVRAQGETSPSCLEKKRTVFLQVVLPLTGRKTQHPVIFA